MSFAPTCTKVLINVLCDQASSLCGCMVQGDSTEMSSEPILSEAEVASPEEAPADAVAVSEPVAGPVAEPAEEGAAPEKPSVDQPSSAVPEPDQVSNGNGAMIASSLLLISLLSKQA